jgi:hypothetical protein
MKEAGMVTQSDQSKLLAEIQRVAALRAKALKEAERYKATLVPLMDKALTGTPQRPLDRASLRDLGKLTGLDPTWISRIVRGDNRKNATKHAGNNRGRP